MNLKSILAAAAIAVAGSTAYAGTAGLVGDISIADDAYASMRTRAEVRAEALQARAAGAIVSGEVDASTQRPMAVEATRSRADVQAELRRSPRVQLGEFYPGA